MGAHININSGASEPMELHTNNDSTSLVTGEESAENRGGFLDKLIEILLVGLFAFMPLALGAVQAWSEEVVIFVSGLIAVLFCCKLVFCRHQGIVKTWAYVPVVIFILITALQLVPLPKAIVSIISPNTAALRTEFLGDIPGSDSYLKWMPLSLYPAATKHGLRLALSIAAIFVVVINVFRKPEQIKRLLWGISLIGGTVALISLSQNIFGNGKIYWFISTPHSKGHSGPFINHSNYGQFMNLSIAAALGILIVRLTESFAYRRTSVSQVFDFLTSQTARRLWLLAGVVSICVATIFLSLTRGGIISMMAAMCLMVVILARTHSLKGHGWLFLLIAFAAFACILYTGFDVVYDRLAMLRNWRQADCGRIQILKDIGVMFRKFPLLGTGLSTHEYVYPMFERSYIRLPAAHAENEYAQALEETGLIGLGTLIAFAFIVGRHYIKCIRNRCSFICSAAYGLGFGIVAILIHSLSDFGQHLPANVFLTATFCALLIVLAKRPSTNIIHPPLRTPIRNSRLPRTITLLGVCTLWFWAMSDANQYRIAEKHWARAIEIEEKLTDGEWEGTDYQYGRLVHHAKLAVNSNPEDIKHRYWLNIYRYWSLVKEVSDAGQIMVTEDKLPEVRDITEQLYEICRDCPTYGEAYFTAGRIEKSILGNDSGSKQLEKAYRLSRNNPKICFLAGYSNASEGDISGAVEKFARAIRLNGRLYKEVALIYIDHLSRPDLAIKAAGDNVINLDCLFELFSDAQYTDYSRQVRDKLIKILEDKHKSGTSNEVDYKLLGSYYKRIGKTEAAIECYQRALQYRYDNFRWRYEFARLLADCGRTKEAMEQARICLRFNPKFNAAKSLLAECSVHPDVLHAAANQ